MNRLGDAGIRVFMVSGNHDAASQTTRHLRLPDNVTMFDTSAPKCVILEDFGVALYGQSFAQRAETTDLSAHYSTGDPQLFNIGVLHTCLDGKPGHEPYAPCTVDGLRSKGYQYWALGHVHTREIISEDPWIVFPGNIQGRHSRETGAKGCTLVTVANGGMSSVAHHNLDVLRWIVCEVDIADSETLDDVYERVRSGLLKTLDAAEGRLIAVRLAITSVSALHSQLHADHQHGLQEYRALATGLSGGGIWLEKVLVNTQPAATAESELSQDDPLHELLHAIRNRELDDSGLASLTAEVSDLGRKLPPQLLGEEGGDPTSPQQVDAALDDVRELPVNRLLAGQSDGN